jgi:hypothetical protein
MFKSTLNPAYTPFLSGLYRQVDTRSALDRHAMQSVGRSEKAGVKSVASKKVQTKGKRTETKKVSAKVAEVKARKLGKKPKGPARRK